jgi:hypothetical protein
LSQEKQPGVKQRLSSSKYHVKQVQFRSHPQGLQYHFFWNVSSLVASLHVAAGTAQVAPAGHSDLHLDRCAQATGGIALPGRSTIEPASEEIVTVNP